LSWPGAVALGAGGGGSGVTVGSLTDGAGSDWAFGIGAGFVVGAFFSTGAFPLSRASGFD